MNPDPHNYANFDNRHLAGFAAGANAVLGKDNRAVAVRVDGSEASLLVEHRFPGSDSRPLRSALRAPSAGRAQPSSLGRAAAPMKKTDYCSGRRS